MGDQSKDQSDITSKVLSLVSGIPSRVSEAGQNVVYGFERGREAVAKGISEAVGDGIDRGLSHVADAVGKHIDRGLSNAGSNIGRHMERGLLGLGVVLGASIVLFGIITKRSSSRAAALAPFIAHTVNSAEQKESDRLVVMQSQVLPQAAIYLRRKHNSCDGTCTVNNNWRSTSVK